jgi:hypothetical protein
VPQPRKSSGSSAHDSAGEEEQRGSCHCRESGKSQGYCDSTPHITTPSDFCSAYDVTAGELGLSFSIKFGCVWPNDTYFTASSGAVESLNPSAPDKNDIRKVQHCVALAKLIWRVK